MQRIIRFFRMYDRCTFICAFVNRISLQLSVCYLTRTLQGFSTCEMKFVTLTFSLTKQKKRKRAEVLKVKRKKFKRNFSS